MFHAFRAFKLRRIIKRIYKALLLCDLTEASFFLNQRMTGWVIPKDLNDLAKAFIRCPNPETALMLISFDPKLGLLFASFPHEVTFGSLTSAIDGLGQAIDDSLGFDSTFLKTEIEEFVKNQSRSRA